MPQKWSSRNQGLMRQFPLRQAAHTEVGHRKSEVGSRKRFFAKPALSITEGLSVSDKVMLSLPKHDLAEA
ncbi:MAG: hypothetical protein D6778_04110 [Nitrospirae bacterium]|nr:MAG: hypothetical protein D6778_04110 [Nitrospirota bacterium]